MVSLHRCSRGFNHSSTILVMSTKNSHNLTTLLRLVSLQRHSGKLLRLSSWFRAWNDIYPQMMQNYSNRVIGEPLCWNARCVWKLHSQMLIKWNSCLCSIVVSPSEATADYVYVSLMPIVWTPDLLFLQKHKSHNCTVYMWVIAFSSPQLFGHVTVTSGSVFKQSWQQDILMDCTL